uniref:Uncharacterized protein n=1 Tax=Nephroselmis pyriformis TaxID=156128 RepID=A0A8A2H8F0_9CHLO|nr:hypothetical protein LV918_pgp076 [Nephroselmis pyriformis]QSV37259.1 hypothetical protein [Nephroselmis pyriformis]
MNSFFLPHVSGCGSWQSIVASFERKERYHADYLYPWLGESFTSLGWLEGARICQRLAGQAEEQAERFQALQKLLLLSETPRLPTCVRVAESLADPQESTSLPSVKLHGGFLPLSWEPFLVQAMAKETTYRDALEILAYQNKMSEPLIQWILFTENRHCREIYEFHRKVPEMGAIREISMRERPNLP